MTDDTGIIQHATYSVPARQHGLLRRRQRARVDRGGARRSSAGLADTRALVTTYLSYLHGSQEPTAASATS